MQEEGGREVEHSEGRRGEGGLLRHLGCCVI